MWWPRRHFAVSRAAPFFRVPNSFCTWRGGHASAAATPPQRPKGDAGGVATLLLAAICFILHFSRVLALLSAGCPPFREGVCWKFVNMTLPLAGLAATPPGCLEGPAMARPHSARSSCPLAFQPASRLAAPRLSFPQVGRNSPLTAAILYAPPPFLAQPLGQRGPRPPFRLPRVDYFISKPCRLLLARRTRARHVRT